MVIQMRFSQRIQWPIGNEMKKEYRLLSLWMIFVDDIVNALSGYECSNCHFASNGLNSGTNFNIEDYGSVKSRVNGCASFETSYLLEKITTGNMASYADAALIEMIEIWISEGAPE